MPRAKTDDTETVEATEMQAGHVRVRVLPKGHGKVHTGKDARPALEADEARDQLKGEAKIAAEDRAWLEAGIACGKTYAKGATFAVPEKNARELEDRGLVEIQTDGD